MKSVVSFCSNTLAMAMLMFSTAAHPAQAQTNRGTFRLPFEASWNGVRLAPGNYSFSLEVRNQTVVCLERGDKSVGLFLVQSVGHQPSEKSPLTLVQSDGVNRVRDLALADSEVVLHFGPGKPASRSDMERAVS